MNKIQILIDNSLKHVHAVIFKSMLAYWLFSGFYPIPQVKKRPI